MLIQLTDFADVNPDTIAAVLKNGSSLTIYLTGGNILTLYAEDGDVDKLRRELFDRVNGHG